MKFVTEAEHTDSDGSALPGTQAVEKAAKYVIVTIFLLLFRFCGKIGLIRAGFSEMRMERPN